MKVPKKFEFMALSARGWLDELYQDARHAQAPAQLKNDFATAMRWLKIRNFPDIRQEHYELWSAGFVCYLAEGKAPSAALKDQFNAFSKWARDDPPPLIALDDEVRGVFGRLLSFDAATALPTPAPGGLGSFRRFRLFLALALFIFWLSFWLWYLFELR